MDKVGFNVASVNFKQNKNTENKKRVSSPIVDDEKSKAAKYAIGATALATIVIAGIATKGKLWGKRTERIVTETQQSKSDSIVKPEELNEEGRKVYLNIKQKLDGKITCKVKDKKSNELNELGQYYHIQEMKMSNIKEQLIKEDKLNYQIEFKKNNVTVKNGEVENLINEKGESWQITEATDKEFVKELKQAINQENDKRVVDELSVREGLNYLEAQEKSTRLTKIESDKNNEEWLRAQHQVKEEEYSSWWNNALAQKAKETLFAKRLETIGLCANGLKLNEEIVANGQKFVFKKGQLEKVLDANNKEIVMDKNVALDELESILSKKYELEVVVPKLKKQIKSANNMCKENINNIQNIFKELEPSIIESGEITKKVADKEYTFSVHKFDDDIDLSRVKIVSENGQKSEFYFDDDIVSIKDGKNEYKFLYEKGKYRLISMNRKLNSCDIGDVSYYDIPYYKSNNQSVVNYKMPGCTEFNSDITEFDERSFYTDLKNYHSKQYLNN